MHVAYVSSVGFLAGLQLFKKGWVPFVVLAALACFIGAVASMTMDGSGSWLRRITIAVLVYPGILTIAGAAAITWVVVTVVR
jgi:hypothetical protein